MPRSSEAKNWLDRETVDGWKGPSDWIARKLDWTTPNWITVAHIAVTPVILALFVLWLVTGSVWFLVAGAMVYTLAVLSDWFDGALARRQAELDEATPVPSWIEENLSLRYRLSMRGRTLLGKQLDPIADKATFYSALLPLGWSVLPHGLLVLNLVIAGVLSVIRWKPIMRALRLREAGANWFGKRKMWVEIFTISWLVLFVPWPVLRVWSATITLGIATLFGAFSLAAHLSRSAYISGSPS